MARPEGRGPLVGWVRWAAPAAEDHPVSRRPAPLDPVALVDRWQGFFLPCGAEDRPLVLTWTGQRGLRAWLGGHGWTDGRLRLTCACCGGVDVVGWEDEPEPVLAAQPVARVLDLDVPAQRAPAPRAAADDDALDLLHLVG